LPRIGKMFILANGDIYDDEEIYGEAIYDYPEDNIDEDEDDDLYTVHDERMEDMICRWELLVK
jgi:hypothetical protein